MTRICFVRHGETDWNIAQRMQGHFDQVLNAKGERQAQALGAYFGACRAAALYSSDLLRARQTAQPIAQALRLPVQERPALRERNFGRCEGLTYAQIVEKYPEDARAIRSRDPDYASPGGESRRQHQKRILDCLGRLMLEHLGQTVVVITHGGVLDVVYQRVRGWPPEAERDYPIPNAGINWVRVDGEQWEIECWGETGHLG